MKKIEINLLLFTLLGVLLTAFDISSGTIIIALSITIIASIYYPLGFFFFNTIKFNGIFKKKSYRGISFLKGFGTFSSGLLFSIISIGVMFKLLYLPGASEMLIIGLISTGLLLVALLIKYASNKQNDLVKNLIIRAVFWATIGGALMATPSSFIEKTLLKRHDQNEETTKNKQQQPVYIVVENAKDTLENGSTFKTRVYLSSEQLYNEAKNNGIDEYLKITFEEIIKRGSLPAKVAEMKGDTGIIEFQLPYMEIPEGAIEKFDWLVMAAVNFKQVSLHFDTAYLDTVRIYIKNEQMR